MMKSFLMMGAAAAALMTAPAQAAVIATLSFTQPTGTVFSNQSIDVYLRLTLDPSSDALTTDASGTPTSGFDAAGYTGPIDLNDPNTRIVFNEFFECSGTFTSGCGNGPPYDFDFNTAQPNFIGPVNFDLQPGDSFEWLFGTFTPTGGNAPAGTYTFYNAGAFVQIYNPGADLIDPSDDMFDSITLAQTCPGQDAACAFTRQVLAAPGGVPEPAAWAMMLAGFGLVGSAMRRRGAMPVTFA